MLTAPEAMPRGADQRCLQSSIDRAQARADESALRLEGGGDVAHAAFFTTIALTDNGTPPGDLRFPSEGECPDHSSGAPAHAHTRR